MANQFNKVIIEGVDYGRIAKFETDGVTFYAHPLIEDLIDLAPVNECLDNPSGPLFHTDHSISVAISAWRSVTAYAATKAEVETVARMLSDYHDDVKVHCSARTLQVWSRGKKTIDRKLEDFYNDLDEEEIARFAL